MNILNKLTIKHLKLNKKRTVVTIVGILLSTALMVGIGLLFSSVRDYMIKEVKSSNGDYHANFKNLDNNQLDILSKNGNTKIVYYEQPIGFSKLEDNEDNYKPYLYITSVNAEYLKRLTLLSGRLPETEEELVLPEHLKSNYKIGDTITLSTGYREIEGEKIYFNEPIEYLEEENLVITEQKTYKIVGIVERSVLEDYSTPAYSAFTVSKNNSNSLYNAYLVYNNPKDVYKKTEKIAKSINKMELDAENNVILQDVSYNDSLLSLYGQSRYNNFIQGIMSVIIVMLAVISIGCIIVIYNSFAISVMERKKQFGLFSSIGATKHQLRKTVFFEALLVGSAGIILGIVGAFLGIWIVLEIVNHLLKDIFTLSLSLSPYPLFIIIPLLFMVVVIFLSAYFPAFKASRITPIEAIRQNDDIKIKGKKIKTNRIIRKLFGMEGELALKNIKRNKKKYRITILSLVISIVMFVSFSAYLEYGTQGASSYVGEVDIDIIVSANATKDTDSKELNRIFDSILSESQVKDYLVLNDEKSISVKPFNEDYYTKNYLSAFETDRQLNDLFSHVQVVNLRNDTYQKIKDFYNLKENQPILLNQFNKIIYSNNSRKAVKGKIFNSNFNKKIDLCNVTKVYEEPELKPELADCSVGSIDNIHVADAIPWGMNLMSGSGITILVNDDMYQDIMKKTGESNTHYTSQLLIKAPKYDILDKKINDIIKTDPIGYMFNYSNVRESMKLQNNLLLVIGILFYGFITLVTLIGVTSVFNTINTSIALRRKEFAMLRSMGLTPKGFNRMLRFESVFFGLKSLLYGLPISFVAILLMHLAIGNIVSFNSILIPWMSILIAIIGVFIIVFLTMMYATNKIKKENILDAIREENI